MVVTCLHRRRMMVGLIVPVAALCAVGSVVNASDESARDVVEALMRQMNETYVFPDVAEETGLHLQERLESGAYDDLDDQEFAQVLTNDVREITHDLHCGVRFSPDAFERMQSIESSGEDHDTVPTPPEQIRAMARGNFAFRKLEMLTGNVGYLDLRGFVPTAFGSETAVAAMNFLANSDAVIIDLRQNGGGHPGMVQLLCSYFFEAENPVHLNSLYFRPSDMTTQFWTLPHVPGKRMPDVPLYVLTSSRTFSAAEEFSYNMQTQERATLVGETTGGGANPGGMRPLAQGFVAFIPAGRAINPITGINWEGVGVVPDISVPANEALDVAHRMALEQNLENTESQSEREAIAWDVDYIRALTKPAEVSPALLAEYAGSYGPRAISLVDGRLFYSRDGRDAQPMSAINEDTFVVEGIDMFKMQFVRDASGAISHIQGFYKTGQRDRSDRE